MKTCPKIEKIRKEKKKHKAGDDLVKLLAKDDLTWRHCDRGRVAGNDPTVKLGLGKESTKEKKEGKGGCCCCKQSSIPKAEIPLIFAASTGIKEIFNAITYQYPQAVEYVTAEGQNVLHVAIIYRQKKIYERIKTMEKSKSILAARIDNYGNTILHHAADLAYYPGGTRPGPALQFQEELEWFEGALELIPVHYKLHRNNNKITAEDLFQENHEEQHKEAQKWMKDTAGSCSTLAILLAGVVFAAAYTVPGGLHEENGLPVLLNSPLFMVFAIMDVTSLALSLTSVVMFLSVLTSPYKQNDFISLPRNLNTGYLFLFLSVLTTMITFAASVLLTVRLGKHWTMTLFSAASLFPATAFAFIMFPSYAPFLSNSIKNFIDKIKKAL